MAAIRALSGWPNAKPAADLLEVADSTEDKIQRTLALRGFVRLIGLDSDRSVSEMVKMYKQAMGLASDVSEKKTVLSGLANVKGLESLNLAAKYLNKKVLREEAAAAVLKIAQTTLESNPRKTKAVLRKVLRISKNDSLRQQAQELIDKIK